MSAEQTAVVAVTASGFELELPTECTTPQVMLFLLFCVCSKYSMIYIYIGAEITVSYQSSWMAMAVFAELVKLAYSWLQFWPELQSPQPLSK